jgi:hypothetical protein
MKVYGVTITEEQIEEAWEAVGHRHPRGFRYSNLRHELIRAGVPSGAVSGRCADRLLQIARKHGSIRYERGYWLWQ